MTEPSPRSSRIALAAGVAAAAALAAGGYLVGKRTADTPPPPAPPVASAASKPAPAAPDLTAPLGRAELLAAVAAAADAYAAGQPSVATNVNLIGRRFELRIPFGCYGPSPEGGGAALRWSYDPQDQALRLSARPEAWGEVAWVRALAGERVEAVEGFWLPRPWSRSEACPTAEAKMAVPPIWPLPRQTVGLAQFFEAGGSRLPQRSGKPYQTVRKVAPEALNTSEGFRLVLTGRITAMPNGQPVGCHSEGAELQPVCLIAAEFERVAFENPATGDLLAEWDV